MVLTVEALYERLKDLISVFDTCWNVIEWEVNRLLIKTNVCALL